MQPNVNKTLVKGLIYAATAYYEEQKKRKQNIALGMTPTAVEVTATIAQTAQNSIAGGVFGATLFGTVAAAIGAPVVLPIMVGITAGSAIARYRSQDRIPADTSHTVPHNGTHQVITSPHSQASYEKRRKLGGDQGANNAWNTPIIGHGMWLITRLGEVVMTVPDQIVHDVTTIYEYEKNKREEIDNSYNTPHYNEPPKAAAPKIGNTPKLNHNEINQPKIETIRQQHINPDIEEVANIASYKAQTISTTIEDKHLPASDIQPFTFEPDPIPTIPQHQGFDPAFNIPIAMGITWFANGAIEAVLGKQPTQAQLDQKMMEMYEKRKQDYEIQEQIKKEQEAKRQADRTDAFFASPYMQALGYGLQKVGKEAVDRRNRKVADAWCDNVEEKMASHFEEISQNERLSHRQKIELIESEKARIHEAIDIHNKAGKEKIYKESRGKTAVIPQSAKDTYDYAAERMHEKANQNAQQATNQLAEKSAQTMRKIRGNTTTTTATTTSTADQIARTYTGETPSIANIAARMEDSSYSSPAIGCGNANPIPHERPTGCGDNTPSKATAYINVPAQQIKETHAHPAPEPQTLLGTIFSTPVEMPKGLSENIDLAKKKTNNSEEPKERYKGPTYNRTEDWINKDPVGQKMKDNLKRTHEINQGNRVYEVIKKTGLEGFDKGDKIVVDKIHKDHLEVFKGDDQIRVANFNGTINKLKTDQLKSNRKLES